MEMHMPIRITCSCGTTAVVVDEYAGKIGKCRKCNASIVVGVADGVASVSGEKAASVVAREPDAAAAPAAPSAGYQNPHCEPDGGVGTSAADGGNAAGPSPRESGSEVEDEGAPPDDSSTWYVILGITNKTFHEDEVSVLQQSGKVRVRGPLTEDQMRTHYTSGTLKPESIIRKSGEDWWKPFQSHDDLFPKSLLGRTAANQAQHVFRSAIRKAAGIFQRSPDVFHSVLKKSVSLVQRRPKTAAAILLSICGLLVIHRLYSNHLNPKRNPAEYMKNVATLYGGHDFYGEEIGKGFFIKPDGLVVTCLHVIARSDAVVVKDGNGRQHRVERVVHIDDKNDLAVLKVSSSPPCPPGLSLGESGTVKKGNPAFALGRGTFVDEEVVDAVLALDPLTKKERNLFRVAASLPNWSDGGPVLDRKGRVVGVATKGLEGRYGISDRSYTIYRGEDSRRKWEYQDKIVIPISPLKEAGSFNGLVYCLLSRNKTWKSYREKESGRGTAYVFLDPHDIEKCSYESNSIADCGKGIKRVWEKRETDVVLKALDNPSVRQMYETPRDSSTWTYFLSEVDCKTHQKRYNICMYANDKTSYNFGTDNKWREMEPELDKEICPQQ
jgi:S1-C subfamily serine protease